MVAQDKTAVKLPPREVLCEELRPPCELARLQSYLDRRSQFRADNLRYLLQICAEVGNEKLVEALLGQGAKPDAFNKTSLPPLLYATKGTHTDVVTLLVRYGSRIDVADGSGKTALMLAASLDNVEMLEFLLDKGADVEALDRRNRSALMHAASSGSTKALRWLIRRGANMAASDSQQKTALLHAVSAGQADALRILIEANADTSVSDAFGRNPVIQAAANNDFQVLSILLSSGCDPRRPDGQGRSPLAHAILSMKRESDGKTKTVVTLLEAGAVILDNAESLECLLSSARNGQNNVLHALLSHGANPNAADANGWSVLMRLASESSKQRKWNKKTISLLLSFGADVYKSDFDKGVDRERTPLQWAAAMGHAPLIEAVLEHMPTESARRYVNRPSYRQKTALHLAAQNDHADVVRVLLQHQADVHATSEGNWTALLIAAKAGNERVIDELLNGNPLANVNARTSSGMTALHWAAENGHVGVIERLLQEKHLRKNPSDSFDTTPILRASQNGHKRIIELLTPHLFRRPECLHMRGACDLFTASVVDFHVRNGKVINRKMTVSDVLFELDRDRAEETRFAVTTNLDKVKTNTKDEERRDARPNFRWIHLPANNLLWAELIITKMIVEDGPIDVLGFQAMLRLFGQQQHRGTQPHSRYMRPYCHLYQGDGISRPRIVPRLSISDSTFIKARTSVTTFEDTPTREKRLATPRSSRRQPNAFPEEQITASPTNSRHGSTTQLDSDMDEKPSKDIGVVFMPYLHWETDSNRLRMRQVIQNTQNSVNAAAALSAQATSRDECLIRGYLKHTNDFHPRRTLDQFKHSSINTDKRDRDQVVYRHFKRAYAGEGSPADPKIFMVDQMWIWTFEDIILTCFPERWGQPRRDRLNIFDGIMSDVTSKSFPPVKSVQDVLAAITHRCVGSFDRHEWGSDDQNFMFFEIFELSIGTLTRRTTALLERFERDATNTAKWLARYEDLDENAGSDHHGEYGSDRENEEDEFLREKEEGRQLSSPPGNPIFVNRLLNISKETELLIECKDIEDELSILMIVLQQQKDVLRQMSEQFKVLKKRAGLQKRLVEQDVTDVERMQKQAANVNRSLTQVLDLKQKHANAIEARFARDQAQDTARQGKTIMVFTLVTIVFLPLSFMASFLAINISQYPHNPANGGSGLDLGWVSKYTFGIGLAVSVPLITMAFLYSDIDSWTWRLKRRFQTMQHRKKPQTLSSQKSTPGVVDDHISEKRTSRSLDEFRPQRRLTRKWTDQTDGSLHTSVNDFQV